MMAKGRHVNKSEATRRPTGTAAMQAGRRGAVHARRPIGSTTTANGQPRPPPVGPDPATPAGNGPERGHRAGLHCGGVPAPAVPGSPAARRRRIPLLVSSAYSSAVLPVLGGKRLRGLVAADRPTAARVAAARRGQRRHLGIHLDGSSSPIWPIPQAPCHRPPAIAGTTIRGSLLVRPRSPTASVGHSRWRPSSPKSTERLL